MEQIKDFIPIIGPVVAALIAALITFVVTVLSKENKTSEFRQAWIESLRNDVSELLGELNVLEGVFEVTIDFDLEAKEGQGQINEFWKQHQKEYAKIDSLCNRIVLRLNPNEHAGLIAKVRELENSMGQGQKVSSQLCEVLVHDFSVVFKKEWSRVKDGEAVFRRMKFAAVVVLVTGGIALVGLIAVVAYKFFGGQG
ncbi:hypothetical protein HU735_26435 [Pseudomonas sp. BW16M2]|uniref:hypothetical protein n=1 Tax=Pseudomonas sp. BW16M2 TaxID=2745489 RepID=UPI001648A78C|nr:hypothetical protein [Pseudomonas sp. BW16M2]MBC3438961.1 hypothetical protein [Pseudomonas sp. BW16M2]